MAESLSWFPGYNLGYINQVVQKNVSCLLTRIMSVAGTCLCPRNALIPGSWMHLSCWSWENPALTDPASTTLFGLSTGSRSFPPSGFPSHLLWTLALTWSSPSPLHSSRKLRENTSNSSLTPDFSKLCGKIGWFTVIHCCCFLFSLPQRGRMC